MEAEARVGEKNNAVQRATEEADTKIISKEEVERGKRERGQRLRQGPRRRRISNKSRRRQVRQGSQGRRRGLRLRRGQWHGTRPKQGRRRILSGLLSRIGRIPSSRQRRGIIPTF